MVKATITPPRKKKPHPAQRIHLPSTELADAALPTEWFEEVRQRAIASGSKNNIECQHPQKAALALWRLSQGKSTTWVARECGMDWRTVRQLEWRHVDTLETKRKEFSREYAMAAQCYTELLFDKAKRLQDDPTKLDDISPDRLALTVGIMTDSFYQDKYGPRWQEHKNFINTVFGLLNKAEQSIHNPMFAQDNVTSRSSVYRTYRLDRISRAVKMDGTAMPFGYDHVKLNYLPEGVPERLRDTRPQQAGGDSPAAAPARTVPEEPAANFLFGKAPAQQDLGEIVKDFTGTAKQKGYSARTLKDNGRSAEFEIVTPTGKAWVTRTSDKLVYVNTSEANGKKAMNTGGVKGGGATLVYQAAMTYAHNNGLEMVPDPNSFSPAAQTRWIPHALSSALRHGTTRHLYPATKEGFILPWKEGNDAFNIQSLRDTELAHIERVAPQTKSWKIGPDGDTFVHADGRKITHETFEKAVRELDPGRTQVGETTLRRGLRHKQIRSGMVVPISDDHGVPLAGLHEGGTPDSLQNPLFQDATSQPVKLSQKPHYYLPEGASPPARNAAAVNPATLGAISGTAAAPTHRAGRFAVSRSTLAAISGAKVNNDPRRANNPRKRIGTTDEHR